MAVVEPNSIPEGLAFDDVLLRPGLSAVTPSATNIGARLTRTIRLNLPIISAATHTVTEVRLAIAMAQAGGIGVIHCNLQRRSRPRRCARSTGSRAEWSSIRSPSFPTRRSPTR